MSAHIISTLKREKDMVLYSFSISEFGSSTCVISFVLHNVYSFEIVINLNIMHLLKLATTKKRD